MRTSLGLVGFVISCALGAGCPGNGSTPDAGSGSDGGDGGPPPDLAGSTVNVTGMRTNHFLNANGDHPAPSDLTNVTIAALVPDGRGGLDTLPGTGRADGSMEIDAVPVGPYWFQFDRIYLLTSASVVDWGFDIAGRPFTGQAKTSPTALVFNVAGMDPWQALDGLQLFSPETAANFSCPQCQAQKGPAVGDTALAGMTTDYTLAYNPVLLDATMGDTAVLLQAIAATSAGGVPYAAVGKLARLESYSQTDGMATTVTGAFVDVPQDHTLTLDWQRAGFASLRTAVNPQAQAYRDFFAVQVQPDGLTPGNLLFGPNLLYLAPAPGAGEVNAGMMQYGDPFPSDWGLFVSVESDFTVSYTLPPSGPSFTAYAYVFDEIDASMVGAGPIAPMIAPPAAPLVDGMDAFTAQTIAQAPTLSWSAPAVGTPTDYAIVIYHLKQQAGQAVSEVAAEFHTAQAMLAVPPDVLLAGESYYVQFTARALPGVDVTHAPLRLAFPYGGASALSALLTVAAH
jgi:hypothetical protein